MYSTTSGRAFFRLVTDETEHIIPLSGPQVTIYGRETGCQQCRMTRMKLDAEGVSYTERDVDTDDAALEYIKSMGYQSVPVVFFGGKHFSGFRPDMLAEIIEHFAPTHV